MLEAEYYKLAFVKDNEGEVIKTLVQLLEHEDGDLNKMALDTLNELVSGEGKLHDYVISELKMYPHIAETLQKQKEIFKASDNGTLVSIVEEILAKLAINV